MDQNSKKVSIIGIPLDLGANIRGASMGPAAIRIADLHKKILALNYDIFDCGDIAVPIRDTLKIKTQQNPKFKDIILPIVKEISAIVQKELAKNRTPICVGGDHSLAIGSVSGSSCFFRQQNQKMGLIWVDAHADINTPSTSPSGNLHGMPLASLLGMEQNDDFASLDGYSEKISASNTVIIGIRTVDGLERDFCRRSGVKYFTMREIDERGMHSIMTESIDWASRNTSGIHVSFDLDAIDPLYAPGVSTPETGGLSYREAHLLLEMVADTKKLCTLDIVELNPFKDIDNKTSRLAVELIQSALGKSII